MNKSYVVFITGASSGIGKSIANALCTAGHKVFAVARRVDELKKLSDKCEDAKGEFHYKQADVTSNDEIERAIDLCVSTYGHLDVLIPNAGVGYFNPINEGTLNEWESMVDVNVTGVLRTIHSSLPHLLKTKGHIINIGSVAARQVFPNSGVYCATKHAVLAISESLRIEFRNELAVTTINPGAVNTEFIDRTNNEELKKEYKPNFDSGLKPEFIAQAVLQSIEASGEGVYSEITLRPDGRK